MIVHVTKFVAGLESKCVDENKILFWFGNLIPCVQILMFVTSCMFLLHVP